MKKYLILFYSSCMILLSAEEKYSDLFQNEFLKQIKSVTGNENVKVITENLPVITVSKGTEDFITIKNSCPNSINLKYLIFRRYTYYNPVFEVKVKYRNDVKSNLPLTYEQFLMFKHNPNYTLSNWVYLGNLNSKGLFIDDCMVKLNELITYRIRGKIEYRVVVYDSSNSNCIISKEAVTGYRKISNEEFLTEILHTVDSSQFKLRWIHCGGLKPIKKEDINGYFGGMCQYRPKIRLFKRPPAIVKTLYNNYQDFIAVLNDLPDEPQTSLSQTNADGTYEGGNKVSGLYPGEVRFFIEVTSGRKSGGYYIVKQENREEVKIQWDFDREFVESYLNSIIK